MDALLPTTAHAYRAPCATDDMTPLQLGEWFHDEMFGMAERLGLAHDHHEDDDYHNEAAGAAIRIAFAGDPAGGVELFNLIGAQRGWEPIRLLCADPILITAGPVAVYLRPEGLDVVPLQPTPERDAATFIDDDDCTVEFAWINGNTFGHIKVKRAWSRESKARVLAAVDTAVRRTGVMSESTRSGWAWLASSTSWTSCGPMVSPRRSMGGGRTATAARLSRWRPSLTHMPP